MIFEKIKRFNSKYGEYTRIAPFYFYPIQGQSDTLIDVHNKTLLNFTTFSYLGLIHHPQIIQAAQEGMEQFGVGLQGTRMLGGNLSIYGETEEALAKFFRRDNALLFQSGFMANLATIQALTDRTSLVYCAKKNHASILDGCQISKAQTIFFDHKNLDHLHELLSQADSKAFKLIVVDSVFSMDGDLVDLPRLLEIRDRYQNTMLMIDESHSLGTIGATGRGIEEHYNLPQGRGADLIMASLSKAIPGNGGIIAGNKGVIRYLRYQARSIMFSSSLPAACAATTKAAIDILVHEGHTMVPRLWKNVSHLRACLQSQGISCEDLHSPITSIMIGDEELAFKVAQECFDAGLYVLPVAFPAVSKGKERLRITITVNHTLEQIQAGCEILGAVMRKFEG